MLDIREELENYPKINIEELEENNSILSPQIKQSLELFNKALDDLEKDSDDMAIIALKKSINLNPTFYEAVNLMGLCYLKLEDYEKAKNAFNSVIKSENNSIKALSYMRDLEGNSDSKSENNEIKQWANSYKMEKEKNYNNRKRIVIVNLIIGLLIGIAITTAMWMILKTDNNDNLLIEKELKEEIDARDKLIASKDDEINIIEKNLKDILNQNNELENNYDKYQQQVTKYLEIDSLLVQKEYEKALEIIDLIDQQDFDSVLYKKSRKMKNEILPLVANSFYTQADAKYYSKQSVNDVETCKEALLLYEKVLNLGTDWEFIEELYYTAGKCASRANEEEKAIDFFKTIIQKYPSSPYARFSQNRLNEINAGVPVSGN